MSHLGSQILYSVLNSRSDIACERVYAPWLDMENLLREKDWPLFSIENRLPLSSFDIVGFSLQYELSYTNVLMMLDLGHIPLRPQNRFDEDPLVIAGGPCAMSAEPIADFIDAFASVSYTHLDVYKRQKMFLVIPLGLQAPFTEKTHKHGIRSRIIGTMSLPG